MTFAQKNGFNTPSKLSKLRIAAALLLQSQKDTATRAKALEYYHLNLIDSNTPGPQRFYSLLGIAEWNAFEITDDSPRNVWKQVLEYANEALKQRARQGGPLGSELNSERCCAALLLQVKAENILFDLLFAKRLLTDREPSLNLEEWGYGQNRIHLLDTIITRYTNEKQYAKVMELVCQRSSKLQYEWLWYRSDDITGKWDPVRKCAVLSRRVDVLIQFYEEAIEYWQKLSDWTANVTKYELSLIYRQDARTTRMAEYILKEIVETMLKDPVKMKGGILRSFVFPDLVDIYYENYCKSKSGSFTRTEMIKKLSALIDQFKGTDIIESIRIAQAMITLAKMQMGLRNAEGLIAAKREAERAFNLCIADLEDSVGWNDEPAFRVLAKILMFVGLENEARVALSLRFSVVDNYDDEDGDVKRKVEEVNDDEDDGLDGEFVPEAEDIRKVLSSHDVFPSSISMDGSEDHAPWLMKGLTERHNLDQTNGDSLLLDAEQNDHDTEPDLDQVAKRKLSSYLHTSPNPEQPNEHPSVSSQSTANSPKLTSDQDNQNNNNTPPNPPQTTKSATPTLPLESTFGPSQTHQPEIIETQDDLQHPLSKHSPSNKENVNPISPSPITSNIKPTQREESTQSKELLEELGIGEPQPPPFPPTPGFIIDESVVPAPRPRSISNNKPESINSQQSLSEKEKEQLPFPENPNPNPPQEPPQESTSAEKEKEIDEDLDAEIEITCSGPCTTPPLTHWPRNPNPSTQNQNQNQNQWYYCTSCRHINLCPTCYSTLVSFWDGKDEGFWFRCCWGSGLALSGSEKFGTETRENVSSGRGMGTGGRGDGKNNYHQFLKQPIEGWKGVKNGVLRVGEEERPWREWIGEVKGKWKRGLGNISLLGVEAEGAREGIQGREIGIAGLGVWGWERK